MTLRELALKAMQYGIPTTLTLLIGAWLWTKFAGIATGTGS